LAESQTAKILPVRPAARLATMSRNAGECRPFSPEKTTQGSDGHMIQRLTPGKRGSTAPILDFSSGRGGVLTGVMVCVALAVPQHPFLAGYETTCLLNDAPEAAPALFFCWPPLWGRKGLPVMVCPSEATFPFSSPPLYRLVNCRPSASFLLLLP